MGETARERAAGAAAPKETHIGFLGAGIMGTPMAMNLLKAGFEVTVWNRTPEKSEALVKAGAHLASSPKEVTEAADITVAMLADPAAAVAVATGPNGAVAGLKEGKGYIDASTVSTAACKEIAEEVHRTGARFLEAPVSGSKQPAEQGTLIFLAAGSKELYDQAQPLLDAMGKESYYLGEVGAGAKAKIVINMVMGMMMASFSEGLKLAAEVGVDQSTLLEAIGISAIAAPMYKLKGPNMIKGEYPTAFPLKHQHKDLRLALELADTGTLAELPLAKLTEAIYRQGVEEGFGDMDFSAVMEVKHPPADM